MLIHQAAHQFRRWTGEDPALDAMSAAAVAELARRTPRPAG
jgi:shikimate 5-dehydrogenase